MKQSVKKKLAALLLGLVKKYLSSSRGQKRVEGVASMFRVMVVQAETGYDEQLVEAADTAEQIRELKLEQEQQREDLNRAKRLINKIQEIVD